MKSIRASEIGRYLYCHRAWWYQKQGIKSDNQPDFADGAAYHRQHGRKVLVRKALQGLAICLILLAIGLFIYYLTASQ